MDLYELTLKEIAFVTNKQVCPYIDSKTSCWQIDKFKRHSHKTIFNLKNKPFNIMSYEKLKKILSLIM